MPPETERLEAALINADAHQARVHFVGTITEALDQVSVLLRAETGRSGQAMPAGVGLVTAIGAALARGASSLLDAGNSYAAAALLRQIVEVEYLLWTIADDPQDAAKWLVATRDVLESRFRPAAMRKRAKGVFRSEEYATHCSMGGHPNPTGASTLFTWDQIIPALWADLGQHLEHVWDLLVRALSVISSPAVIDIQADAVFGALNTWRECDPWAFREPIPRE